MEEKGLNLEEAELRQTKLALQFKDLLDCINSTRDEILSLFQEVQDKEKQSGVLRSQVEAKSEELCGLERLIEEKSNEVDLLKSSLCDFQSSIEEHNEELSAMEKRLKEVQRWVREKEREYDSIKKGIEHGRSKLNWYEEAVEEKSKLVESKEEKWKGVLRTLKKYDEDIEFKKMRLNEIRGSIEEQKKEFALKNEQIKEAERKVDQCDREMKVKEKKLSTIQKSIEEYSKKIQSREKIIDAMDLKVKDFSLLKKSMEEWSTKLELKEREFESKVDDLTLIQKGVNECLNEVQLKEQYLDSLEKLIREEKKNLDSQEKSLQECFNGLELKERQLEQRAKELELKQQDIDSIRNSTPDNRVIFSSSTSNQSSINKDGGGLQLLMKESLTRIDSLSSELSAFLQASSDPAKLVLDAMQGFYPSNSTEDNMGFNYDLIVIRRSCVLLLQELKRLSPQINPLVREEAMKLADNWKENMTVVAENSLEVLGLLWLLTAFDLTSTYNARELQSLLALVSQPEHAPQLRKALGMTYKASDSAPSIPVKIEEPELSTVRNVATSPSPILQLTATATTDARSSQGRLDEHLSGNDSANNELLNVLQLPVDREKIVLNLMEKSLHQYWSNINVGFIDNLMKTYIPMLDGLMKTSSNVSINVKKAATSLAVQWQAKMKIDKENSLEILGFLQFVDTYGLLSTLSVDDTVMLLGIICQSKRVLQLCQILSFANKIPGFIWNLIERKQLIKAVRLVCTFKLTDRFPPIVLLNKYAEDVRKSFRAILQGKKTIYEKVNWINNLTADLRGVIQCIKDHNLESEYPYKDIELEIVQLERLKDNLRRLPTAIASRCEQQVQERRKRCSTSSAPQFQPPEKRQNRSHPTAVAAAARSCTTFCSQLNPSSQLFGNNYGHPGQFNMAANHHETGGSSGSTQLTSSSQLYENYGHPLQFATDHEIGANFGRMQLSSSSRLAENYELPPLPLVSNEHEIGTDFRAMKDAGLYNSNQFLPGTHGSGPSET